jgi:ABC-type branched-subunit amino acid transport system substrate-binding protein
MFHLKIKPAIQRLLILLLLTGATAVAQTQDALQDSLFSKGVKFYAIRNFDAAQKQFDTLVRNMDWNKNRIASHIFLAKIALTKFQYPRAESMLKDIRRTYSDNPYYAETMFTLSEALWRQKKKFETFTILVQLANNAGNDSLRRKTVQAAGAFLNKIQEDEVEAIIQPYRGKQGWDFVTLALGLAADNRGESQNAHGQYASVIKNYPLSPFSKFAEEFNENAGNETAGAPSGIIAVVLPLAADDVTEASGPVKEVLDGIRLAIDRWNNEHGNSIGLLVFDSQRDTSRLKDIIAELKDVRALRAIIGPLFSDECRFFLERATELKVPILSPTANDEGLNSLSHSFFQLNPPFSERGKLAAQYASAVDQKHKVAVLYSDDPVSELTAAGFIKEFIRSGGEVVELKYKNERTDLANSMAPLKTEANDCDAIFAPISDKRFVAPIFSALNRMGVSLPVFGNQEWINAPGFEISSDLSAMLTIVSDYFLDYADAEFDTLNAVFFKATGYEINKNVSYGYGAAGLILQSMKNAGKSDKLAEVMRRTTFIGLHSGYAFTSERVNTTVNIIRFVNGKYYLIERRNGIAE